MQETQELWFPSLGQEDPLEKAMHSTPVLLPGKFHGQRSWRVSRWGRRVRPDRATEPRAAVHVPAQSLPLRSFPPW